MSFGFDSRWYHEHLAKQLGRECNTTHAHATESESELHDQIIRYCKDHGWRYVHSRMDKRATVGEGTCDFIIFADNSRVFCFECKSASGKLSMEQRIFIAWLDKLGHRVHVIDSFQQFLVHISTS